VSARLWDEGCDIKKIPNENGKNQNVPNEKEKAQSEKV
jgi:hypothetical protein